MPCDFDPEPLKGVPLGMFHCPYCGEMVLAGAEHPDYDWLDTPEGQAEIEQHMREVERSREMGPVGADDEGVPF